MDKNSGIDYNREAFLTSSQTASTGVAGLKAVLLVVCGLIVVTVVGLLGYRAIGQGATNSASAGNTRELTQLDLQIAQLNDRIDQLEQANHRLTAAQALANSKKPTEAAPTAVGGTTPRVVYRISPTVQQPKAPVPDPATTQKLTALQESLGAAQSDATANREAWQATTNRLADVAGQVGSQNGEILRSQDQLNELLSQTQRSSLPFELHRGASPEQLGPVTVALKSTNSKNQRYTLCVYVQNSCVELKDRTLYEVVEVALVRTAPPLQVIATRVGKDGITGYLEIPHAAQP